MSGRGLIDKVVERKLERKITMDLIGGRKKMVCQITQVKGNTVANVKILEENESSGCSIGEERGDVISLGEGLSPA